MITIDDYADWCRYAGVYIKNYSHGDRYRTIEEKILQLQEKKRNLADSVICADQSLIKQMTVDDLKLLLS